MGSAEWWVGAGARRPGAQPYPRGHTEPLWRPCSSRSTQQGVGGPASCIRLTPSLTEALPKASPVVARFWGDGLVCELHVNKTLFKKENELENIFKEFGARKLLKTKKCGETRKYS